MITSTSFKSLLASLLLAQITFASPLERRQEDPQVSLTLSPEVVQPGLAQDGQGPEANPAANQVPSLTSVNNFINFCLTQPVPLTNGQQIDGGSCNPAPIGRVAARDRQPSSKFIFPPNFSTEIVANQAFTLQMRINNLITGNFVNPNTNYYASPQTVNQDGIIIGHSHVVIQQLPDIASTQPLDPAIFAFFKGLNQPAENGIISQPLENGLPAGVYRMCSINASMSHAPVIVSNAQHGSLDDCIYFTVVNPGEQAPPPQDGQQVQGAPAGGEGAQQEAGVEAGGEGAQQETGVEAGGEGAQQETGVEAGGEGAQQETGVEAGGEGAQQETGVEAGGEGAQQETGADVGAGGEGAQQETGIGGGVLDVPVDVQVPTDVGLGVNGGGRGGRGRGRGGRGRGRFNRFRGGRGRNNRGRRGGRRN